MTIALPTKYSKLSGKERATVRQLYKIQQNHKCMFCHEPLDMSPPKSVTDKKINWKLFPLGFLNSPIHLQHNHDNDYTEGAVHAYCNAVLWQYHGR